MSPPRHHDHSRRIWRTFVLMAVVVLAAIAMWPVTSRQGVNYVVAEHRLPLWRKAIEFLARDRNTTRLARTISRSATGDEESALAVLRWTNLHIRPHPPEAPVIDDHVWSIIERGYGSNDQQADVFTTLLTYAGTPAYWILIGPPPRRPEFPVSLALIDSGWRVFDVQQGIAFRNDAGGLATAGELAASTTLIRSAAATAGIGDVDAYVRWFEGFSPPEAPQTLRARMQMPGPRIGFELRKLATLGGRRNVQPGGRE